MAGDGCKGVGRKDRLAEGTAIEGKENRIALRESPAKFNLRPGEATADKGSFIPPEHAEVFVHGTGIAELIHAPHEAGRGELVGMVCVEVDGGRDVGPRGECRREVVRDGHFQKIEVEDPRLKKAEGDSVATGGDSRPEPTTCNDCRSGREAAVEFGFGVVIEANSHLGAIKIERGPDVEFVLELAIVGDGQGGAGIAGGFSKVAGVEARFHVPGAGEAAGGIGFLKAHRAGSGHFEEAFCVRPGQSPVREGRLPLGRGERTGLQSRGEGEPELAERWQTERSEVKGAVPGGVGAPPGKVDFGLIEQERTGFVDFV